MPADDAKIVRAVRRAARYCSEEKAIQLVAMNSRFSIGEVRAAVQASRVCSCGEPEEGGEFGWFDHADGHTYCNSCGAVV